MSPKIELFQPPKEWKDSGTGIGTLMPTMPQFTLWVKLRATSPLRVKIATPLPYSCSEGSASASSKVLARTTDSTGPKISSL